MYCEKCGAKNDDLAKFCESCGAPVVNESENPNQEFLAPETQKQKDVPLDERKVYAQNAVQMPPKKPMSTGKKVLLIVIGVLIAACIALYYVGKTVTEPKKIVENYMKCVTTQNYEAAYDLMDIEKTEFTTKELFAKIMSDMDSGNTDIVNYAVKENVSMDPLTKSFIVTYTQKGQSGTSSTDITLIKQPKKKWLLFDDYKIAETGIVAKNYIITIPCGAELFIDGKKVDAKYIQNEKTKENDGETVYLIPSLFTADYKMKVTAPFAIDNEAEYYVHEGVETNIQSLEVKSNAKQDAANTAEKFVKAFIENAIAGKEFTSVQEYLSQKADTKDMQDIYDEFSENGLDDEGEGIKNLTVSEFKATPNREYQKNSNYGVSAGFEYKYTRVWKSYDDEVQEDEYDDMSGSATVYFVYEDGAFKVIDVSISL